METEEDVKAPDVSVALVEAIQEIARQAVQSPPPAAAAPAVKPKPLDLVFFLLFICNVAFLILLIPREAIEGPHWELLKDTIPVLGGSLLVLIGSWYKDWTLTMCGNLYFRIAQVALVTFLVFSMWINCIPIRAEIDPGDATLFRDEEKPGVDEGHAATEPLWVSLRPHHVLVRWTTGPGERDQPHERKFSLSLGDSLRAGFGTSRPRWVHIYPVMIAKFKPSEARVRIVPDPKTPLDKDFLHSNLAEHSLELQPDGSLLFSLGDEKESPGDVTRLPSGTYTMTAFKPHYDSSKAISVTVNSKSAETVLSFEDLKESK